MEGMACNDLRRNSGKISDLGFTGVVFSWSLEDINNENLFKNQVEKIPKSFESVHHYFGSYNFPLLEETRASLHSSMETISRAPIAEVTAFDESKPYGTQLYDVNVDYWKNRFSNSGKEPYKTLPGDILVLADAKPESVSDLERVGRTWAFAEVTKITDDENEDVSSSVNFKVRVSKDIEVKDGIQKSLFVIFLMNITTNKRMYKALNMFRNLKIIKEILSSDSSFEESCSLCSLHESILDKKFDMGFSSDLNESQTEAVLACLSKVQCNDKPSVKLIWGPPGTGKTKTVSVLLFTFLRMKCRTLTCAPTNVAIKEIASRVLQLMKISFETESEREGLICSLGDVLLFGNKDRLKVGSDIEEIYLDFRVKRLAECFGPLTGWWHCFTSMIDLLEDCVSHYQIYLENELMIANEQRSETETKKKECRSETDGNKANCKSFLEFLKERFISSVLPLKKCVTTLCTHIPRSFLLQHNFQNIISLLGLLDSFKTLLFSEDVISEQLEELFSCQEANEDSSQSSYCTMYQLYFKRRECLSVLKTLRGSLRELKLPSVLSKDAITKFCYGTASLIFCTASSSYKLHSAEMQPLKLLVIDEAAQLKECESAIPLQLPGLTHSILIGDECQLPSMVQSTISDEAGFGRSLFERLSSMGHSKNLLDMQYRMHPSISFFPSSTFYSKRILDAPCVKSKSYKKSYLPGPMFGPYSFINIIDGREEREDVGRSRRNMVEVAVVLKIVRNLYKAWSISQQKLSVGVISPYNAQVAAIQERIGRKYEKLDGFSVKVKSIDGFQGGEEDIIIISTVRSNSDGSIGFVSNRQRTNVALTRARHCLWILGHERTLANSESVWEALVRDAKERQCFFNADDEKELANAILEVKKEFDQLGDLISGDSVLFKKAIWKVVFSDCFKKSFQKLSSMRTKTSVMNLLVRLSGGWRPKKRNVDTVCESSSHILKQFKVEGLYVICTVDIIKESNYVQVLKVWDLLPLEDVPKLVRRLDSIFETYTDNFINHCQEKCLDGNLEVPKTWATTFDIVRYKSLTNNETGVDGNAGASDSRCYVENSKVSESLLLMKFYSLSPSVVSHLLSDGDGRELDLPFEVTEQEMEIILFSKSTFILGRSGTGKTTILTMKLYQKERLHYMATQGLYDVNNSNASGDVSCQTNVEEAGKPVLRQLFVTVSPKLCYAVKQHVSQLKSFACGGKDSAESNSVDADYFDDIAQFKDIPDSLIDIHPQLYPLVITFHKFLMMLDGTMGNSYFERFSDVREFSTGQSGNFRSMALQTFVRTKEVYYEKFSSFYWPHFNAQLTKKLDPSRVFTEIISHIKGGLRAGQVCDQRLNREEYVLLSESRVSTLSSQKREIIYDIYLDYEKMKTENGEFDISDLVIDLHRRLKEGKYEGDIMDFVYIDEVQDLTMRQIALFKFICKNVHEGFVFCGDTAQTIARGIDFRFEDIRSLFYNEFLLSDGKKEKGQMSKIFHLSQNFRTHAGVLKLAQSVIDLLYRFFPLSVDILGHETSLIYGEPPILLESGNDENAIVTIFGNSHNLGGNMVGFGAEQVILVRDDSARQEISKFVGKQALVLTIVECKGLEFQDVLLYNFFGSSPLKNQWRIVYEYMKEQNLLDASLPTSFPHFSQAKHNVLCSELKQLYVAITRTRQRLWICENMEDFSKPIFDYWNKMCLVHVRKLDDSLAQAMQVASSPEEWKSRGYKLLREGNYEMATMCFERAGDTYGEKLAKAAGLKASADQMHVSNPDMASMIRREAAEIFESIGKVEYAAECFYMLKEYERAGRIYLENCGDSQLEKAGECFSLAECYELAAEVYAKGDLLAKCLAVCSKGKLFDIGLRYIQYWKQHTTADSTIRRKEEIDKIEHEFLESCALHYYELKDNRSMLKFVKAFHSMDLKRAFLKMKDCLDELLLLEEESGNFVEAANIAKQQGDLLREVDLLGKAARFKEGSILILWYVFANSLWSTGSKGWPLKCFTNKEELLTKAKLFAKNVSDSFYEYVCTQSNILSHEQSSLSDLTQYLSISETHNSLRGEILCARKVLDGHLPSNPSKYVWEEKLVFNLKDHSEEMLTKSQVSMETLFCFWNFWMEKTVMIFEYLHRLESEDVKVYASYGEFCLNYLGVRTQYDNLNTIYLLLNPNAEWVRELDDRFLRRKGKLVSIDLRQFVATARSYWSSELLSVGMKVLDNLEVLYRYSLKNSTSVFCQCRSLTRMYEVAKSLLDNKFLDRRYHDAKTLEKFIKLSSENIFGLTFSLDFQKSLKENMISLRGTEVCRNLFREFMFEQISLKNKLTYGQIGRVAVMILGFGNIDDELYNKIARRFDGNQAWKVFIDVLCGNNKEAQAEMLLIQKFQGALADTYNANWMKEHDYISTECFLYLVERYLILACQFQNGYFFTTKFSFIEWFINRESGTKASSTLGLDMKPILRGGIDLVIQFVQQLLFNKKGTIEWLKKSYSNVKDRYPLLVLRLVSIVCLLYANFGVCLDLLFGLLGRNYIAEELPYEFYDALRRTWNRQYSVNVIAGAFKRIENPLILVSVRKSYSEYIGPDTIFVDMKVNHCKEDILRLLFPVCTKALQVQAEASNNFNQAKSVELPSSNIASTSNQDMDYRKFCEIFDAFDLMENGSCPKSIELSSPAMKVNVHRSIIFLTDAIRQVLKNHSDVESKILCGKANIMLDNLKQLDAALAASDQKPESDSIVRQLLKSCSMRRQTMVPFFTKLFGEHDTNPPPNDAAPVTSISPVAQNDEDDNKAEESGKSDEGTMEVQKDVVDSGTQETAKKGKGNKKPKNRKKGKQNRK